MLNVLPLEMQQGIMLPIELGINAVLRQAPASLVALNKQQGKVLALHLGSQLSIFIQIRDQDIGLSLNQAAEADASLSGTISDFIALALAPNKADSLINSKLEMTGDSDFAIALTRIADDLDIDWEALISPATGGILAHQLGKAARGLLKWGKQNAPLYQASIKHYLEDETRLLASQAELAYFADQVDALKLGIDRLAARLAQQTKETSRG